MGHVRTWAWALAVAAMAYGVLCFLWPPAFTLVEERRSPAFGLDKGSSEQAMPDSWALDIPGWGATAFEKGDTPGKWTSIGESGIHQVRLIRVDPGRPGERLRGEWQVTSVPFHLRGLGWLFGARQYMRNALLVGLESWEQGVGESEDS